MFRPAAKEGSCKDFFRGSKRRAMGWGYRGSGFLQGFPQMLQKERYGGLQGFRALAQDPSRFHQVSGSIGFRLLPSGFCAGFRV